MKRIMLLIAVILVFITGCQHQQTVIMDDRERETVSTSNTVEAEATAGTTMELSFIKSLDDFYRAYHSLKIQKNGESTVYDAANPLEYIFADMLSKVQEVSLSAPEGEKLSKEFDYTHYDYRLKFEGAADILFTLKGNVFHFDGEKQLYVLWGDSKPFWNSLAFDTVNNTVDMREAKTPVMINMYQEDVDGDGKNEDIALVYERGKSEDFKGDLTLSINGSKATVLKGEEWFTKPYPSIGEMPEIRLQQEKSGKSKAVLVISSWSTNGIGSTGVVNAYKYTNKHVSEIRVKEAEQLIKYKGNNMVDITFPAFKRTTRVEIDSDQFRKFLGEEGSLKQQLEAKGTFSPHPLWYLVKDYNGDGQAELCSVSILRMPPLALCRQYTYYKYEGGELKPVHAFVTSFYSSDEKKKYLKESIFDLMQFNGYLTLGAKGIADEGFRPGYDYTPSEIKETLEELQRNKILKLKGDRLYMNY